MTPPQPMPAPAASCPPAATGAAPAIVRPTPASPATAPRTIRRRRRLDSGTAAPKGRRRLRFDQQPRRVPLRHRQSRARHSRGRLRRPATPRRRSAGAGVRSRSGSPAAPAGGAPFAPFAVRPAGAGLRPRRRRGLRSVDLRRARSLRPRPPAAVPATSGGCFIRRPFGSAARSAPATPVSAPAVPAQAVPPAAAAAGTPTPARPPINPFLANDPNAKAKRLARALVSDIVAYFPAEAGGGLRDGTLKQLFREEIKKSYEEYVEQVGREFAETHDALPGRAERRARRGKEALLGVERVARLSFRRRDRHRASRPPLRRTARVILGRRTWRKASARRQLSSYDDQLAELRRYL